LEEFFNDLTVIIFERNPLRFEARPSIRRAERPGRNLLVAKVDCDRHVSEDAGFALGARVLHH
jgi:hypothetical protein